MSPRKNDQPLGEGELDALRAEVARLRADSERAQKMIRELGDAVAARDTFIAIAGHELRNPMGAIIVNVSSIAHIIEQSPDKERMPPRLVERLASLDRQSRTFVRRATTLLDVSRITSGELRLEPELVDLSAAARDVLEDMSGERERAGSPLAAAIDDSVCGWWDRAAIEEVLYNLVSNAIKYGAGKPIRVALTSSGGRASLSVADEGIGISQADSERIFSRFERAVTQRTHGGFGLGLWITQQLVDASGGLIRVQSAPGAGSIFTVELPQGVERLSR